MLTENFMCRYLTILLICALAPLAQAQSLYTEKGESRRLLLGGFDLADEADTWLVYYGLSVNGEVDLGLQINRTSMSRKRTAIGITPGVQLFLVDVGNEGTSLLSGTIAYEIGTITGGEPEFVAYGVPETQETHDSTYTGFSATGRFYQSVKPDGRAFFYMGISYVWLQIKTDLGDWTNTLRGTSKPVHIGFTTQPWRSMVTDLRIEHTSSVETYLFTVGWLL
jgi:hypothetical protein